MTKSYTLSHLYSPSIFWHPQTLQALLILPWSLRLGLRNLHLSCYHELPRPLSACLILHRCQSFPNGESRQAGKAGESGGCRKFAERKSEWTEGFSGATPEGLSFPRRTIVSAPPTQLCSG